MNARPILFSAPMVRAILAGEKTQARRIAKPRHVPSLLDGTWADSYVLNEGNREWLMRDCPYGAIGDRLWVRETWCYVTDSFAVSCGAGYRADESFLLFSFDTAVIPDGSTVYNAMNEQWPENVDKWRPSIYMPRWASRITLEITDVRLQRLQGISEDDARAEGVIPTWPLYGDCGGWIHEGHLESYKNLWGTSYGAGAWDENPWVWALTFKQVTP